MKELSTIVTEKITSLIDNGDIESIISKKLEMTIEDCINDAMRSYSDFGQAIKSKIEESINFSLKEIKFPEIRMFS